MLSEATDDPRSADELGHYRSLSTLAVVALLLGLAAPLAFTGRVLVVIPLAGIAVACLALAKVRSSGGALTGKMPALAGLALAIMFLVAPFSHRLVRDQLSIRLASDAAQQWLAALSADRFHDAAAVMTPTALYNLLPRSSAPDAPPPEFSLEKAIGWLRSDPMVLAIEPRDAGSFVQFHCQEAVFTWTGRVPEVVSQYRATGTEEEVELVVMISRREGPEGQFVWLVKDWRLVNPGPGELEHQNVSGAHH